MFDQTTVGISRYLVCKGLPELVKMCVQIFMKFLMDAEIKVLLQNGESCNPASQQTTGKGLAITRSPHLRLLQPTIRNSERKRRLGVKLAKSHLPIFLKLDFCYKISVIYFFLNVFPIVCYVFLHTCATRNSAPINFDIL